MGYIDPSPDAWDRIEAMLESAFTPAQLSELVYTRFPDLHRHVPWREPFATISHRLTDVANRREQLVPLMRAAASKLAADPIAYRPDLAGLAEELAGRPTTTPPPEEQADARIPVRHILPPPVADFTGRAVDLDKLLTHLHAPADRTGPVAGIRGMGGIGKTQLALAVAQQLRDEYPDQVMIELQPGDAPLAPDAVLGRVIHAFQPELKLPADLEELQHTCRNVLANRRGLLLLDNALDARQVKPLLPPPAGWAIVVTSRARFPLAGGCLHDVDLLPPDEAVGLLGRMLSDGGRDDLAGEDLAPLVGACCRLPLALCLAAGYLTSYANRSLASYLAALGKERLKHLTAPDEEKSLRAVLGLSVDRLRQTSAQAAQQWRDLAVFPAPFDAPAAAAVWELAEDEAEDALGRLVQQSLVEHLVGEYRLHDLLREVALEEPLVDAVRYRHAAHYLRRAGEADILYQTAGSHILGLQQFDPYLPQLLHAWQWLKERDDAAALQWLSDFPGRTAFVLDLRVRPADQIALRLRAAEAAQALGDRYGQGVQLGDLGNAYYSLGQVDCAIKNYRQALAIAREIGDRHGEGNHLNNLGLVYADLGQVDRAIACHEKALAIAREIGDHRGEGNRLGNLGLAYADLGQVNRAIDYLEEALAIAREIGDRRGEGNRLGNLGLAYAELRQVDRAIDYHEQALTIAREIGDHRMEGNALGNLGLAYAELGQMNRAIQYYEQALAISREIGDRRGEGNHSWNLGDEYRKLGDLHRAVELMQVCVDYEREIGHPDAEADAEAVAAIRRQIEEEKGEESESP